MSPENLQRLDDRTAAAHNPARQHRENLEQAAYKESVRFTWTTFGVILAFLAITWLLV